MNLKGFLNAMKSIEADSKIPKEIVVEALKEALSKAYKKHVDLPDILVRADINEKSGVITLYQQYTIIEEVEDDEFEISLSDAKELNEANELGGIVEVSKSIDDLGRAAAVLAKNVMKQKIREAEKQAVYDEYIDLLDEMVLGLVESVEEKFVVLNLGKTMAIMPRAAQIPTETYREGQRINVVITECSKDTKGAQVLVSRADSKFVKRLFEREVPEIYEGIVEIKAIAREAGERTKMAVYSSNSDVDPIGACIGPRGSRVSLVINELHGEKIDIFEWSENIQELIKNSLAPAQVIAVVQNDDKRSLTVIVEDNQLSLAIGKKGKNARLAVKLTNKKIDIKTKTDALALGIDYKAELEKIALRQAELNKAKIAAEIQAVVDAELAVEVVAPINEENSSNQNTDSTNEVVQEKEVKRPKKAVVKKEGSYVSKFEKLLDVRPKPTPVADFKDFKKRKPFKEEERKLRPKDIKKDKDYEIKPVYSEAELELIAKGNSENASEEFYDSVDYDEYDSFYDENLEL